MASQKTLVGIDIGRHSVKAVWAAARAGGKPSVRRAETLRLPQDGSDLQSMIVPWIQKLGLARASCVMNLPGRDAMFQPFILTPADPRALDQAAAMEVVKFNEMASETMTYDFHPFAVEADQRSFLLAMARPSVLARPLSQARDLGLNVVDLVPTPVALFNAMEAALDPHTEPALYIDIGHSTTSLAIGSSAGLLFARSFGGGGQLFTDELAKARGIPASQAENLKTSQGALFPDNDMQAPLHAAAELWLSELQAGLSVYQSVFPPPHHQPSRIVLSGGGSLLKGLPEYIASELGLETTRLDTLPGLDDATAFVSAAGLALSGQERGAAHISLLPGELRDRLAFRRQRPFWTAAALAAFLILGVSVAAGWWENIRRKNHLVVRQNQLGRCESVANEIETIKARNSLLRDMAAPVEKMFSAGTAIRQVITLLSDSMTPGDFITSICDAESYFTEGPVPPKEGVRPRADKHSSHPRTGKDEEPLFVPSKAGIDRIVIEGYTRTTNLTTVKALISKFKAAPFVASVDLLSDDHLVTPDSDDENAPRSLRRFVIDLKLKTP